MLIDAENACLLIVDVQERLCPVMDDPRLVLHNCARLMKGAGRLGVPLLVSEQYPKGIGHTMVDLRELFPEDEDPVVEKMAFACSREAAVMERMKSLGRSQVIVAGIEAHVCVLQTALGLKEEGFDVFVVRDACSSRRPESAAAAWDRLAAAGVSLVTTEMALFEMIGRSGTQAFKDLLPLIK